MDLAAEKRTDREHHSARAKFDAGLGNDAVMRTFAGGWDWVVTSNLFSSMRLSVQSTATARVQGPGLPTYRELGVNTFQYTTKPGQNFMRNGNAGWGANGLTGTFDVLTPSLSQDFDWIKGAHSLSFGGSWTRPNSIGDGTFQSQRTLAAGNRPESVAAADVNGDGWLDLITANAVGNDVSVLLGNGDGTFQPQQHFAAGDSPASVAAADVNGDGRLDLVAANFLTHDVSVLLGNGDGSFQPQRRFEAGGEPSSVVVRSCAPVGWPLCSQLAKRAASPHETKLTGRFAQSGATRYA